ncbi:heterokaryon incompatibility protein-domain-containing protein [Nemania abortiva]|nr:heterokaryon incompatibility protein-domain-containing protein [Nemania abortiva]
MNVHVANNDKKPMRCAACSALRTDKIWQEGGVRLHDNLQALKDSAQAGCDFCALCWAACEQRLREWPLREENLRRDSAVWLTRYFRDLIKPPPEDGIWWKWRRDHRISIKVPNNEHINPWGPASFHTFADPGTPAAHLVTGSWTTPDRNRELYINLARCWLKECLEHHKFCASSSFPIKSDATNPVLPTRLIDVGGALGGKYARLVITDANMKDPYLALSYVWGNSVPRKDRFLLRKGNLYGLQQRIDEDKLAKTHREAIQLTRDLEFRYIWIDALCIIHDDDVNCQDWDLESVKMAQYYGNATLTVIAAQAKDSADGFVENKWRPNAGPCDIPFFHKETMQKLGNLSETDDMGTIGISMPRSTEKGPITNRGWCFQEEILSRRQLIFGEEQLQFQCREGRLFEDSSVNIRQEEINSRDGHWVPPDNGEVERWLTFWYVKLCDYSARELTVPEDIFAAISGLAQAIKPKVNSRYLAGLWEADMPRGLLWAPEAGAKRRHKVGKILPMPSDAGTEIHVLQVPSWSWAAFQGPINRRLLSPEDQVFVRTKDPGRWTLDETCHVTATHIWSCELEFVGRLQRVTCSPRKAPNKSNYIDLILLPGDKVDEVAGGNHNLMGLGRVVAYGWFDVAEERVNSCWCLPIAGDTGLMLDRDKDGKFHRLGVIEYDSDVNWADLAQEQEICLI